MKLLIYHCLLRRAKECMEFYVQFPYNFMARKATNLLPLLHFQCLKIRDMSLIVLSLHIMTKILTSLKLWPNFSYGIVRRICYCSARSSVYCSTYSAHILGIA
jgi:hypothetical protein